MNTPLDKAQDMVAKLRYPQDEPDAIDIGSRHYLLPLHAPGGRPSAWLWWHDCPKQEHVSWSWFGTMEDGRASGHTIQQSEPLTIGGSLLCPQGCGDHGFIRDGRWVTA